MNITGYEETDAGQATTLKAPASPVLGYASGRRHEQAYQSYKHIKLCHVAKKFGSGRLLNKWASCKLNRLPINSGENCFSRGAVGKRRTYMRIRELASFCHGPL